MTTIPIIISSFALVISILTLIINRFVPFLPKVTNSSPTFSLYKITPKMSGSENNQTWWIPSFDIGVSLYNLGKRTGKILDFRIVAELNSNRTVQKFEFYPKWVINYSTFQKHNTERFTWINDAVESEWYPVLLFGDKEMKLHIILEGARWDYKFSGNFKFRLEYISSKKEKWILLDSYELLIDEEMFEEKSSYTPFDKTIEKYRRIES